MKILSSFMSFPFKLTYTNIVNRLVCKGLQYATSRAVSCKKYKFRYRYQNATKNTVANEYCHMAVTSNIFELEKYPEQH